MKAMDLKQRMGALTGAEKERYEQQFVPKLLKPEGSKIPSRKKRKHRKLRTREANLLKVFRSRARIWMA